MALRSVKLLTVREKSLRCVNCMSLSTLKIFFGLAGKVVEGSNVFTVRTVRTVRKALKRSVRKSLRSVSCTSLSTLGIFPGFARNVIGGV